MLGNESILSSFLAPLLLRVARMVRVAITMVLVLSIVGVMVRMRMRMRMRVATIGMTTLPFGLLALTL